MPVNGPPLLDRAARWRERQALATPGRTYTYEQLLHACHRGARLLLRDDVDLHEARVVFLTPPGADYVATQWAIWAAGGVAVPLSASQAPAEWDYIVGDTEPRFVLTTPAAEATLRPIAQRRGAHCVVLSGADAAADSVGAPQAPLPPIAAGRPALILYTSGTTSRPKGVVTTHANIAAQVGTLVEAWRWTAADRILHVLPLNHVHGIINVLSCALWSGACCEFLSPFDAVAVWERFVSGGLTLFMAVPTIYAKLVGAFDAAPPMVQDRWAQGAQRLRLMVSGSAALPTTVLERWRAITGHVLLERYGMTEIGMALSNPLEGRRRPGFVGVPLPGVEVRLVDEQGWPVEEGVTGEIEVRGPSVFREYWRRPEATIAAFRDGWFRTGDVAVVDEGSYRILGRSSVDIIKTGGYKVSALEIEEALREHPAIAECGVVGVPDEEWGERVAVAVVVRPTGEPGSAGMAADKGDESPLSLDVLRAWAASRLAKYKLPTRLAIVESLPRNAMGKVVKGAVKELFAGPQA